VDGRVDGHPGTGTSLACMPTNLETFQESVAAMSAIPARMVEAWNRADATGFYADFADDVVFVELEGTIYRSRADAIAAQEQVFATVMKGSRLVRAQIPFAQLVSPDVGVVHQRVGLLMPGEQEPPATRYSMQLYVMAWRDGRWVVAALENARLLTMESLMALESMPA
jgi:uncharacterized protein (TIGR02246 family)